MTFTYIFIKIILSYYTPRLYIYIYTYISLRYKSSYEIFWVSLTHKVQEEKFEKYQMFHILMNIIQWRAWPFVEYIVIGNVLIFRSCMNFAFAVSSFRFQPLVQLSSCVDTWWHHQMKTFSALLALCVGNSPVTGEFPSQRPVTRSIDVFFDLRLNKWLSKQSWCWWFETPSRSLWRHCNDFFPNLCDYPKHIVVNVVLPTDLPQLQIIHIFEKKIALTS